MPTKVKICGITNAGDARRAAACGADWLGFNFYERSPRYVTPAKARGIIRRLPRAVKAVGVFVNAPAARVLEIVRDAGLYAAQLHGEESPRMVADLSKKTRVWKAVRVKSGFRAGQLRKFAKADAILLDAFSRAARGGTGKTFDWKAARAAKKHARVVLAGGLTPGNVTEAIRTARPYAVDVASGVERAPGKKDAGALRAFMSAVSHAGRGRSKRK